MVDQNKHEQESRPVVANTFDVEINRIPDQAITLEQYQQQGGADVTPQGGHLYRNNFSGNAQQNGDSVPYSYRRSGGNYGSELSRSTHAIVVDKE